MLHRRRRGRRAPRDPRMLVARGLEGIPRHLLDTDDALRAAGVVPGGLLVRGESHELRCFGVRFLDRPLAELLAEGGLQRGFGSVGVQHVEVLAGLFQLLRAGPLGFLILGSAENRELILGRPLLEHSVPLNLPVTVSLQSNGLRRCGLLPSHVQGILSQRNLRICASVAEVRQALGLPTSSAAIRRCSGHGNGDGGALAHWPESTRHLILLILRRGISRSWDSSQKIGHGAQHKKA
mmetsp:Transcript_78077/g.208744  ORF Transcript_78077/g.208744 Transcript_78077/m.208744 type:complete len:237 (+) Transcript_78077:916-1626(+)